MFQGVTNILCMVLSWFAIALMPMGDAIALIYTFPIFSILFGYLFYGEKAGIYSISITALSIIGAVLIVEPTALVDGTENTEESNPNYLLGVFASLGVAIIGAGNNVITFQLQKYHPYILLVASGLVGLVLTIIICPLDNQNKIFHDFHQANVPILFLSSILGIFGLFLNTYSCQKLNPVIFAVLRCQEVVIAFVIQAFSTGMNPSLNSITGTIFVLLSSLLVPMEEYFVAKSDSTDNPAKPKGKSE